MASTVYNLLILTMQL